MIEYIISKLGMLVFVLAVASVLLFFSISMKEIFLKEQSVQIANILINKSKDLLSIDSICSSTYFILPRYIDIFGSTSSFSASAIHYVMDLNKYHLDDKNYIVFKFYKKKGVKLEPLVLDSFTTEASIIFKKDTGNNFPGLRIDPSDDSQNVIYIVKDYSKEKNLYIVKCGYNIDDQDPLSSCKAIFDNLNLTCVPKN